MTNNIDKKQLRSFGLTVGGIFSLIGLWPVLVGAEGHRWWALCIAGGLIVPAIVFPSSLSWLCKRWIALGHFMGEINTKVILGVVFYFVVTPIGIARRMVRKDSMSRRLRPDIDSYRIPLKLRSPSHLKRQY